MRITDRYQSTIERVAPAVASTAKPAATTATADTASSAVLDIHVSAQAKELSNRAAAVEQLKKQVEDGSFKVDPDAIAAKLVGTDE